MKRSRFSEEQIIGILREAGGESTIKAVCAKHNVSEATFYTWRKKYGGMDVPDARRLRALEEENSRLKRVVGDLSVQIQILKEVNAKKW
jgi:putative transposase